MQKIFIALLLIFSFNLFASTKTNEQSIHEAKQIIYDLVVSLEECDNERFALADALMKILPYLPEPQLKEAMSKMQYPEIIQFIKEEQ